MDHSDRKGVLVIEPDEYMDLSFKQDVLPVVERYLDGAGEHVLVDCGEVDLINSYGISALLSIYDRLDGTGGILAFARVDAPLVQNALEISGLASFCREHLYDDVDEAMVVLSDS